MIKVTGIHPTNGSQLSIVSDEISKLIPETTSDEHHQRVEEWTQKSQSAPPSNKKKTARQAENEELEAKSLLVDEALRLLDHREEQLRARPNTTIMEVDEDNANTSLFPRPDDVEMPTVDPNTAPTEDDWGLGKRFKESKMSAKNYVKEFEAKVNQKKAMTSGPLNISSVKGGKKNFKSKILSQINKIQSNMPPVVEPDAWRHKASRSVRFTVKPPSTLEESLFTKHQAKVNNEGTASEDDTVDSKWQMKHENDRDWWKWKLKQRFMQNDELLQKLASQRRNLESSFNLVDTRRRRVNLPITESGPMSIASSTAISPQAFARRNSSRHVTVEIAPQPMETFQRSEVRVISAPTTPSQSRFKDPAMRYYNSSIATPSTTVTTKHKLKTLKKDPYLAKLLAGNEMFKPEMMLDVTQSNKRHELSQPFKSNVAGAHNTNDSDTKRKISLESLTDSTDDDFQAAKFFNPDVKILYERMSELEANKFKSKVNNLQSREPSDGFFNLPLLLATGRFNRYNKLPKVIPEASSKQTKKFEKFPRSKSQAPGSRKRTGSAVDKTKPGQVGIVAAAAAAIAAKEESSKDPSLGGKKIEELSTKDWAKQLMSKMKPQVQTQPGGSKTDTDSFITLSDDDDDDARKGTDTKLYNYNTDEILEKQKSLKKKYKVPIDQETNMLYHEILMSKWKKEKHDKDLTGGGGGVGGGVGQARGGPGSLKGTKFKFKKGGVKRSDINKMERIHNGKPRGLDIWLENIREKAKRDRLIGPLPNPEIKEMSKKVARSQPVVTTYNNAAFNNFTD